MIIHALWHDVGQREQKEEAIPKAGVLHNTVSIVRFHWAQSSYTVPSTNTRCTSAIFLPPTESCEVIKERGITHFNMLISPLLKFTSFFKCSFDTSVFNSRLLPFSMWFPGTNANIHTACVPFVTCPSSSRTSVFKNRQW